ncbi:MAG: protein kinase [Anaerolineae bacterium]|nr:protein kinase [Anaerolineae bacterium]
MSILRGRYELHEKLGEGGMAEVYRATQLNLDREVAVKFIKTALAGDMFSARFAREAKALAQLIHPHIMQVYDFDQAEDGRYFMVMERLRGSDLSERIHAMRNQDRLFSLEEVYRITRDVGDALFYAHQHDVVHRDIKPSNIWITDNGRVVVTDFGIAKMVTEGRLTETGMTIGTPHYFAPEQGSGLPVDYRVDIYALGVVFYELLTGSVPYDAESTLGILAQHANAPIPDPREIRPDLPPETTTIVRQAMAKDPNDRYQDMGAFIAELDTCAASSGINDADTIIVSQQTPTPAIPGTRPASKPRSTLGLFPRRGDTEASARRNRWPWLIGALVALLVLAIAVLIIVPSLDSDETGEAPFDTAALDIAPAAEGEYLVVITNFGRDETTGIDVSQRSATILAGSELAAVVGEPLRVEHVDQAVSASEQAAALAETTGALVVMWGTQDATGLEVVMQAFGYPENTLDEVRFRLPADEDLAQLVTEDLPFFIPQITSMLSIQQLIYDEQMEALTRLMTGELLFNRDISTSYQIMPVTARDQYVIDFLVSDASGDSDAYLTNALALAPDDPALVFNRLGVNFILGRYERVKPDLDWLQNRLPNNGLVDWMTVAVALTEEDFDTLLSVTEGMDSDEMTETTIYALFGRPLALLLLGDFKAALKDIEPLIGQEEIVGFPIGEPLRALLYEAIGDETAAAADRSYTRASRLLEQSGATFVSVFANDPPASMLLFIGYTTEIYDNTQAAMLAYQSSLLKNPDDYLVNWRAGVIYEQQGNFQHAFDAYVKSADIAPVPFPVVEYRAALLLRDHTADITTDTTACEFLDRAQTGAQTDPELYTVLLGNITSAQVDLGCEQTSAAAPVEAVAPAETGGLDLSVITLAPAAEGEYLYVVADIAGDDAQISSSLTRRVSNIISGSQTAGILGDLFRLENLGQRITTPEQAAAVAEATGALVTVWGIQDVAGIELVLQAHGYPDRTMDELRFLIPTGESYSTVVTDELPVVLDVVSLLLAEQQLIRDAHVMIVIETSVGDLFFPYSSGDAPDLHIMPVSARDQNILEAVILPDDDLRDAAISRAIDLAPDDPAMLYNRLGTNFVMGRFERMQQDLDRLEALIPGNPLIFWLKAGMALSENDFDTVLALPDELPDDESPEVAAFIHSFRVLALIMLGDFETAVAEGKPLAGQQTILGASMAEPMLALVYEITGDETAAEANRKASRASRLLEQSGTTLTQWLVNNPVGSLVLLAGYLAEINYGEPIAMLAYQGALINEPDHYLLNWRAGILYEQQGNYQHAYDAYVKAADVAPVPFPTAEMDAARVLFDHPDDVSGTLSPCEHLDAARSGAETNPSLYTALLDTITAASEEFACAAE